MARRRWLLLAVFAWAAFLRFSGLAWDSWTHQNPDERFLVMVEEKLAAPRSLAEALSPGRTPLNPNNRGEAFYVYGALPPDVTRGVAALVGQGSYDGLLKVGRVLTCFLDLLAMGLVMGLVRRLAGFGPMATAGLLYGSTPLLLQQARFATVDTWGLLLVVAAAWEVVGREATRTRLARAGVWVGLAAACKPNLAAAGLIPATALLLEAWRRRREGWRALAWGAGAAAALGAAALVSLKLADPGLFAAVWSPLPNPRRLDALRQLSGYFAGLGQFPPNLQWADRRLLLDPLANLLVWGTGPFLGLAALVGLGRVARRAVLGDRTWWPALAWMAPAAGWQLTRFVCSVRHLEVLLPFGVAFAALWLRRHRGLRVAVVAGTMLWGVAWASIAWRPYTRVEASRWLRDNLPKGAGITAEYWDDALPLSGGERFHTLDMHVFDPDTQEKRDELLRVLDAADAVVLSSQRGVGSICRVPGAYPLTAEYYHLLFSGALGFRLAATFQRRVGILSDLSAEETLSVYDHPPVWIFTKTDAYSPELARRLLGRVELPGSTNWDTRALEARGTPPYQERWNLPGTMPGSWRPGLAKTVWSVFFWVVAVEAGGLAGRRLLRRWTATLPDGGWGVARWVGLAGSGVVWLWLGWARLPGWNGWLPAMVLLVASPWLLHELLQAWREPSYRRTALLVWGVFLVFLAIRAGNPEIYWGEKPMDAAVLGSVWRASAFPPVDPWFAGAPLNYYFFGYLPYALLARAGGIGLGLAYNLTAAAVPALTVGAASSLGCLLAGRWLGGVLAAFLAQLSGTAAAVFHPALLRGTDFNLFWATSRVIPGTINEYPVWTALFADLHAHFFGFPGFLATVFFLSAMAMGLLRGRRAGWWVGGAIAVEVMTNTWEVPALLLLALLAVTALPGRIWRRRVAMRLGFLGRTGVTALVVSAPFWMTVRPASGGAWTGPVEPFTAVAVAELFGLLALLLLLALAVTLAVRPPPRTVSWAWKVAVVGVVLVAAPAFVTVADHMNTVFKLHLQAHLLLAAAAGGVLGWGLPRLRRGPRAAAAAVIAPLLVIGLATAVGDTLTVLHTRRTPGPRPTLDGRAYLARFTPEKDRVLAALAALPYGATVAEPLGSPYSDTLRVPMLTGLPDVVGWSYHLWQRRHAYDTIDLRQADQKTLLAGEADELVPALVLRYHLRVACAWDGVAPAVAALPRWREAVRDGDALAVAEEPP